MRLIDADALKHYVTGGVTSVGILTLAEINAAPTVDPIHYAGGCYCWECEYSTTREVNGVYGKYIERRCENDYAPWNGNEFATCVEDNDFCSYGRRKEDTDGKA